MSSPARRPLPLTRGGRRRRVSLGTLSLLVPALWAAALAPCAAQARPAGHAPAAFQAAARRCRRPWRRGSSGRVLARGCPVALSGLRLLTVTHRGFDGRAHTGRADREPSATGALTSAFRALYERGFPIRHMRFDDFYGPRRGARATAT